MNESTSHRIRSSPPDLGTCMKVINRHLSWSESELQQRANNVAWLVREAEACVVLAAGYDDDEWIAIRLQSAVWRLWDILDVESRTTAFEYLEAFVPERLRKQLREAEEHAIGLAGSTILPDGSQDDEQLVQAQLELIDLSPDERQIFKAAFGERRMSNEEIAVEVGESVEFVRAKIESFFERSRACNVDDVMRRVAEVNDHE